MKQTFRNANFVAPLWVFDVSSDRAVADVKYERQLVLNKNGKESTITQQGIVYINEVFTHAEYDKWTAANRKGK